MYDVKTELEALNAMLLSKGCGSPELAVSIRPHSEYRGELNFYPEEGRYEKCDYNTFYAPDLESLLKQMRQKVYSILPLEERRHFEYLKRLASTIEYGKSIGLDDHFINPLELQMKKLSGNILEHKPTPVTPTNLDDDCPF